MDQNEGKDACGASRSDDGLGQQAFDLALRSMAEGLERNLRTSEFVIFRQAWEAAIATAAELCTYTPWIPVAEKMPDEYETVLIGRTGVPWPITGFWTGEKWVNRDVREEALEPTHWIPLPPGPNAEITGRTLAQNEADGA